METYTLIHVLISLIGIGTGFVALFGLLTGRLLNSWTAVFLTTTVLTSVTGFGFPFERLLPSHVVGILSLIVLAVAIAALYRRRLEGGWRTAYIVSASIAQYFNVFVLVVQSFNKVPALKALAPTQTEPPFVIAQLTVLLGFVALTTFATKKFHPAPAGAQTA